MAYIYDPAIAARKGGYVTPSGRRIPFDYTRMDEAEFESK